MSSIRDKDEQKKLLKRLQKCIVVSRCHRWRSGWLVWCMLNIIIIAMKEWKSEDSVNDNTCEFRQFFELSVVMNTTKDKNNLVKRERKTQNLEKNGEIPFLASIINLQCNIIHGFNAKNTKKLMQNKEGNCKKCENEKFVQLLCGASFNELAVTNQMKAKKNGEKRRLTSTFWVLNCMVAACCRWFFYFFFIFCNSFTRWRFSIWDSWKNSFC